MHSNKLKPMLVIAFALANSVAFGQYDQEQTKLKSQLLLSLTRHIGWADDKDKVTFGIIEEEYQMYEMLQNLSSERFTMYKIDFKMFKKASDAADCDILFITKARSDEARHLEEQLTNHCVVITEEEMGQTMTLFNEAGKVYFEINEDLMNKLGLPVSKNLLALSSAARK